MVIQLKAKKSKIWAFISKNVGFDRVYDCSPLEKYCVQLKKNKQNTTLFFI